MLPLGHLCLEVRYRLVPAATEKLVYIYSNRGAAAAVRDGELKMLTWMMNDAALAHDPAHGGGTAAYLHSARRTETLHGRLVSTEVLQPEGLAQTAPAQG